MGDRAQKNPSTGRFKARGQKARGGAPSVTMNTTNHGNEGGGEPPMNNLEARVEHLEQEVSDIKLTLARIEAKLDNCVTWKAAFAWLAMLLAGLCGIAWWTVQQILGPILQSVAGG